MIPLPKVIKEIIKAKAQTMTLNELVPPRYGEIYIGKLGAVLMDVSTLADIDPKYREHYDVLIKGTHKEITLKESED